MPGILIEFPDSSLARAREMLDPGQLRRALFQAIKRTTAKGTTIARKEVQNVLNISKKYVDRAVTTRLETHDPDPPVGFVRISRRRLPLIAYKPTGGGMRRGRGGIRAKVWKDRPPIVFNHGFKARVNRQNATTEAEFHDGVFIRTRHASANPKAGKLTAKGFAGRLAIKQLMGPSVESAVEIPKVAEAVYEGLEGEAEKQLKSQMSRFTK